MSCSLKTKIAPENGPLQKKSSSSNPCSGAMLVPWRKIVLLTLDSMFLGSVFILGSRHDPIRNLPKNRGLGHRFTKYQQDIPSRLTRLREHFLQPTLKFKICNCPTRLQDAAAKGWCKKPTVGFLRMYFFWWGSDFASANCVNDCCESSYWNTVYNL